jgi:hypothetical protein
VRPLIFLDMDGVLNDKTQLESGFYGSKPECVAQFNRILRTTSAEIVLSSAWRYMIPEAMTLQGFTYLLLTHGVACRTKVELPAFPDDLLIGTTCRDEDLSPRGQQIRHWLNECGGRRPYVVLDDGGQNPDGTWSDMGIADAGHPVVWTDGKVGMTAVDADRAIQILTGGAHAHH